MILFSNDYEFIIMRKYITPSPVSGIAVTLTLALAIGMLPATGVLAAHHSPTVTATLAPAWVATWQASPQPVWGSDFLFPTNVPDVLNNQTVRQVARVSLGGQRLRIVLSNAYGREPIRIGKVTVAQPTQADAVVADSLRTVTFGGAEAATILPGASLVSDPVALPTSALSQVAVSVYLPQATPLQTFHWDGRQTGWIVAGDQTEASGLKTAKQSETTARLLLSGIQVETGQPARAVAVIGDSITDGATASQDEDTRWPDFLAERLAPHGVAVINAGISGARLLSDGMGVNALARFDRDVSAQPGMQSVIVMLGINDISWPGTAFAPKAARPSLDELTAGFRQVIERARSHGIRVVGATLTPFEGALPGRPLDSYYHADKDALRRALNEWIRRSGAFDAVIDFDAALRDPDHPARMAPRFDSGDHLHPGDEGNRAMAEAVDLDALLPGLNAMPSRTTTQIPQEH